MKKEEFKYRLLDGVVGFVVYSVVVLTVVWFCYCLVNP